MVTDTPTNDGIRSLSTCQNRLGCVLVLLLLTLTATLLVWHEYWNIVPLRRIALAAYPGQQIDAALTALGPPFETLDSRVTTIDQYYTMRAQRPVPRVERWTKAYVYQHFIYMHVVFVGADGRVICVATSHT